MFGEESQSTLEIMPYGRAAKRRRTEGKKPAAARKLSVYRAPRNQTIIIPRTVDYDKYLTADFSHGFGFSVLNLWVNGVADTSMPGGSELTNLFEFIRVAKVEITIMPGQSEMAYTATGISETRNIPWLYEGFDPNDGTNPSLDNMRELASTRTHLFNKVIRRTIYPNIKDGGQTDLGRNQKNLFVDGTALNTPWYGYKIYMDMVDAVWTYSLCRVSFKVFYECKMTR